MRLLYGAGVIRASDGHLMGAVLWCFMSILIVYRMMKALAEDALKQHAVYP